MPLIYIHGVNTRDTDDGYKSKLAARNELLRHHVLAPLAAKDARLRDMAIVNPYWGGDGVAFRWHLASLPEANILEHLGAEVEATPQADLALASTIHELAGEGSPGRRGTAQGLENLGAEDGPLAAAARQDLTRFVEAILLPLLVDEMQLDAELDPEQEGLLQALLATAAYDAANSPGVQAEVAAATSDDEVMEVLKAAVQSRFAALAEARRQELTGGGTAGALAGATAAGAQLESLGPGWFDGLTTRVGELFDRAKDAPGRVATLPVADLVRADLHRNISRFLGDVFVYLKERGDAAHPGPIVATVLDAIRTAPRHRPDEPLIVVTHSMGGNILYDILTCYAPELKVDVWISAAAQVAQLEEMKLFLVSDKAIAAPAKVKGLKPRLGYWLNVYDPADPLAFLVAPVFADVDADVMYRTGASTFKAHGEYFGRASFYQLMREHIAKALA
jgi:hypothetical protein